MDFGGVQTIERVVLYFLDDGEGIVPPSSYAVEILQEGTWQPADVRSRIPGQPTGRRANTVLMGPTGAAGVRVHFEHAANGRTGLAEIEVWTPAGAEVEPATSAPTNLAINTSGEGYPRMTASFPEEADVSVLQDGQFGLTTYQSNRWITRDSPNATDWIRIDFEEPTTIREAEVYLWGNSPWYLARVDSTVTDPRTLSVEVLVGAEWQPVSGLSAFPDKPLAMARNLLRFDPIETHAVRILFTHADGAASGATEIIIR